MSIKLYHHPLSTYSRRVRIALIEKKIPYESIVIDMATRQHREPAYLALNPYGRVPTLADDDFVLYESNTILNYLEAAYPAPALLPADQRARALVDMHMRLCDAQMARPSGTIIFPKRFLPKEKWNEAAIAAAKGEIEKHFAVLERQLEGKDYLVGDGFTLADLAYIPFIDFVSLMEIAPPSNVAAWIARLCSRPSAAETRAKQ
jgi:glutathione S-transferase